MIINKTENFIAKKQQIEKNQSGFNQLPKSVDIIQGKNRKGRSILIKINSMMYLNFKNRLNKNRLCSLRCKYYRDGCSWTGKIIFMYYI